jgi:hypothetical protein
VKAATVQTVSVTQTNWDQRNAPLANGVICFDQLQNPWRCHHDIPDGSQIDGVVASFRWQWPRSRSEFANITVRFLDTAGVLLGESRQVVPVRDIGESSLALFRCPLQTKRCEFVFRNAYRDSSVSLADVELSFVGFGTESDFPVSSVGMIVADPSDLPGAVDEIVTHYAHYLQSAVEFGEVWASNHDPDCTLHALQDRQSRFRRVA